MTTLQHRLPQYGPTGLTSVLAAVVAAGVVTGVVWSAEFATYDTFAGILIGLALMGVSLLLAPSLIRREADTWIGRLVVIALFAKLAMTVMRFAVTFVLYDGASDAAVYHAVGIELMEPLGEGIFDLDLGRPLVGTGFIQVLTGMLYVVTGPTKLGAFFVFGWLGFWGLYLTHRAFQRAVPEGDHRRYAVLVLMLPSLLFWPSSLGKEAWMALSLGLVANGASRVLTHARHGVILFGMGTLMGAAVRPHVVAMLLLALGAAYAVGRRPASGTLGGGVRRLVGIALLGTVLFLVAGQAKTVLGIDSFNNDAIETSLAEVNRRTDQGGSSFEGQASDLDPSRLPSAVVAVLFRPFPWEVHNLQSAIAAMEGTAVLILVVSGWRRIVGGVRSILRTPYVLMCVVYSGLFSYGFASFANFGILTRQRVQVLPFALVLLALPRFTGRRTDWRELLAESPSRPDPR